MLRFSLAAYGPILFKSGSWNTLDNVQRIVTSGAKVITGLHGKTQHDILLHSADLLDFDSMMREECVRCYARALQKGAENPLRI